MHIRSMLVLFAAAVLACVASAQPYSYNVQVVEMGDLPVIAYLLNNSDFQQVFNPGFVEPSAVRA